MATTYRILGPLEVRVGGDAVPLGGLKQRAVLAMLLLRANEVVTTDALIDGLWGGRPPATARGTVQVYVSQLRRALAGDGDGAIATSGQGYVIRVAAGALDLQRFDELVAAGRAAADRDDPAGASAAYAEALALWRGAPLADFAYEEFAQREIAHLDERRLACREARIDADLRLGRHADVVSELEQLVAAHPWRERLRGQLMVALYGSGRHADALARYAAGRRAMIDELGIEPGPELRELEGRILRQDPDLLPPRASGRPRAPRPPRRPRRRRWWAGAAGGLAAAALAAIVAWIAGEGGDRPAAAIPGDALVGIDARSGRATEPVALGGSPSGVAVIDGAVWVGDRTRGAVKRIDPERGAVVQTIPAGGGPDGIAAGEGAVWATNALDGTLLRISPRTDAVVQTIPVPNGPRGVAVADGSVWVASRYARTLARIDAATGEARLTARIGGSPIGIAVGAGAVWTTHETDAQVWRHDPRTGRVQQRIGVGNAPGPIAVGDGAVWVANTLDGTVSRIDPASNAVVAVMQVGEGPAAIAVADDGVWVAAELGGAVVRIDPAAGVVAERIETRQRPAGLAADGGRLWVAARDASAEHRGGTLRVSVPAIDGIDQGYSSVSWMNLSGDGLTGYRRVAGPAGAEVVPDLATSLPTPTDDGRTYVFAMREGIRYSTGEPVRAGDIRRGIERFFRLTVPSGQGPDYYDRIVGARACRKRPATCDLSRGIVADEAANTVTIHLTEPDADLLHRLALPFAHAVAPSAPEGAPTTEGLPATGPYVIASHVPGREVRFVRNPNFEEWSRAARPDGYPDEILVTVADDAEALEAVDEGRIDVDLFGRLGAEDVARLTAQHPDRVSVAPVAAIFTVVLNTRRPPFDREAARRAVAFALDREELAGSVEESRHAQVACQILPPSFPAHEPYCPFTTDAGDGHWHGPDLPAARALVARSGTAGAQVTVMTFPEFTAEARQVASILDEIGYRAEPRIVPVDRFSTAAYGPQGGHDMEVVLSGWLLDYPAPSTFLEQFRCEADDPSDFCDPEVDARIDAVRELQVRDPAAADAAWAALDRTLTDRAAWVPYAAPRDVRFVSERLGNLVPHPVWRVALDQAWVR